MITKIYKMLETAAELEFLMADMSPEKLNSFAAYKAKLNAIRQSQMESSIEKALKDSGLGNREVTPFMRLQIVGLSYKTRREKPKEGIVTIWNPTQKQESFVNSNNRDDGSLAFHPPLPALKESVPSGKDPSKLRKKDVIVVAGVPSMQKKPAVPIRSTTCGSSDNEEAKGEINMNGDMNPSDEKRIKR